MLSKLPSSITLRSVKDRSLYTIMNDKTKFNGYRMKALFYINYIAKYMQLSVDVSNLQCSQTSVVLEVLPRQDTEVI